MSGEQSVRPSFKVGDVVRLKSGGYPMTVEGTYQEDNSIMCYWHNDQGDPCKFYFGAEMIELISNFEPEPAKQESSLAESALVADRNYTDWRRRRGLT